MHASICNPKGCDVLKYAEYFTDHSGIFLIDWEFQHLIITSTIKI